MATETNIDCGKVGDIYDAVPAAVWCVTVDGVVTYVNKRGAEEAERPKGEIRGRHISEIFPNAASTFMDGYAAVAKSGKPQVGVVERYVDNRGNPRWSYCNKVPKKEGGKVVGVVVLAIDITAEKQREAEIMRSEERFRMLFEATKSGVVVYQATKDGNFTIVDFNTAAERIEGVRRSDVIGRTVTEAFPGVDTMGLLDIFRKVHESGVPQHHQASAYSDEKRSGWRENYVYKLPSGEVVAVYDDVTEKKKTAAKLNSYIQKLGELRTAVNSGPAVVLRFSHDDLSIRFASDNVLQFGYAADDLSSTGRSLLSIFHEDDRRALEGDMKGLDAASMLERDLRVVAANGAVHWVRGRFGVSSVHTNGAAGIYGVLVDITSRKQDEIRQETLTTVLEIVNRPNDEMIGDLLAVIKNRSGADAVAVRLRGDIFDTVRRMVSVVKGCSGADAVAVRLCQAGDYPYCYQSGFSDEFVRKENSLVSGGGNGECDLACMCGRVIRGLVAYSKECPWYSRLGSFWTNSTSDLIRDHADSLSRLNTRNSCNAAGYESVALVPLRSEGEIVGLLQINDRRRGMFTEDAIAFYEKIGQVIGIAVTRQQTLCELECRRRALARANKILSMQSDLTRILASPEVTANVDHLLERMCLDLKCKAAFVYKQSGHQRLAASWVKRNGVSFDFPNSIEMSQSDSIAVRTWIRSNEPLGGQIGAASGAVGMIAGFLPEAIRSLPSVMIPVVVSSAPWGFMGLVTECDKSWAEEELRALSSLATLLALCIDSSERARALNAALEERINEMATMVGATNGNGDSYAK